MTARPPIPSQLAQSRIVAILRGTTSAQVVAASRALVDGGVSCLEVTLTTEGALEAISELCSTLPGSVAVGAGTVLDAAQARAAIAAGATFLVSPAVCPDVIAAGNEAGVPSLPGAFTPTEILTAWRAGAAAVKLFPAASVGPDYLKLVRGPLADIPLVPTGGVRVADAASYLRAGAVAVGLGSTLVGDIDRAIDAEVLSARASSLLAATAGAR